MTAERIALTAFLLWAAFMGYVCGSILWIL